MGMEGQGCSRKPRVRERESPHPFLRVPVARQPGGPTAPPGALCSGHGHSASCARRGTPGYTRAFVVSVWRACVCAPVCERTDMLSSLPCVCSGVRVRVRLCPSGTWRVTSVPPGSQRGCRRVCVSGPRWNGGTCGRGTDGQVGAGWGGGSERPQAGQPPQPPFRGSVHPLLGEQPLQGAARPRFPQPGERGSAAGGKGMARRGLGGARAIWGALSPDLRERQPSALLPR